MTHRQTDKKARLLILVARREALLEATEGVVGLLLHTFVLALDDFRDVTYRASRRRHKCIHNY